MRKENLFLYVMSQDVFEKVTEKLEMKRSGLRQEFDDKFNFDGFRQAYHEYIQEHHQYERHPDFNEGEWEYFWLNTTNSSIVSVILSLTGGAFLKSRVIDVANAVE